MGQPRKKKKRRKKRYLLKFTILVLLAVGAYFFLTSEFFDIQEIEVENNSYYTAEQIIDMAGARTGHNLFETKTAALRDKLLKDPYIKSAKVRRKLPASLVISVEERREYAAVVEENVVIPQEITQPQDQEPVGTVPEGQLQGATDGPTPAEGASTPAIQGEGDQAVAGSDAASQGGVDAEGNPITSPQAVEIGQGAGAGQAVTGGQASAPAVPAAPVVGTLYVILDRDGMVLRSTDVTPGLPLITGLTVKTARAGKPITVEENLMLSDTLTMIEEMNENDLFFKRIAVTPVLVKAYVYDTLACEGAPGDIAENMARLKDMLGKLYADGTQRGMIRVVSDDGAQPFVFSPLID